MKYFAMIDGACKGPYTLVELAEAGVTPSTYVWSKGMKDWEKAEEVADICRFFRQRIASLQHPGTIVMPGQEDTPASKAEVKPDDGLTDEERKRLEEIPQSYRGFVYRSGQIPTQPPRNNIDINQEPRSFLLIAVLATILCCPIIGFIAIYFSFRTRTLWRQAVSEVNNENASILKQKAHDASRKARMWTGITICIGIMIGGFFIGMNG